MARIVTYSRVNRLLIQATPENIRKILDLIKELDVKPRQVFLEAAIALVEWDSDLNETIERLAREPATEDKRSDSGNETDPGNVELRAFSEIVRDGDFPALLKFIKDREDCRLLASPVLLVGENEQSRVAISETRFVQNTTVQSNQTTLSSQAGEDAGTTLSMRPMVAASQKAVRLEFDLTVSQFVEGTSPAGTLPPKIEALVSSSMTVPTGRVLVFGGVNLNREGPSKAESANKENLCIFLRASVRAAP